MPTVREQIMKEEEEELKVSSGLPKMADDSESEKYEFGSATMKRVADHLSKIKEPKDVADTLANVFKAPQGLAKEDSDFYNTKKAEFEEQARRAEKIYEQNKNATAWARIGEMFGHALIKLAAAERGLKDGIDYTTGLKQEKADWERMFDRLQKDLNRELTSIDRGETLLERRKANLEQQAESLRRYGAGQKVQEAAARERKTEKKTSTESKLLENAAKELNNLQQSVKKRRQINAAGVSDLRIIQSNEDLDETKLIEKKGAVITSLQQKGTLPEPKARELIGKVQEDPEYDVADDLELYIDFVTPDTIDKNDAAAIRAYYMGQWKPEDLKDENKKYLTYLKLRYDWEPTEVK